MHAYFTYTVVIIDAKKRQASITAWIEFFSPKIILLEITNPAAPARITLV